MSENSFSSRLKTIRVNAGLTQARAAEKLTNIFGIKISQQRYQSMESGTTEPSLDMLKKICVCFNVSADWLLGLTDDNARPEPRIPEKLENLKALGESAKDVIGRLQSALIALDKTI